MRSGARRQTRESAGESFIPDLCNARAVVVAVVLAELLVLIYTLAVSGLPQYNWLLLAEASPFVQWLVLLNSILLCLLRRAAPSMGVARTSALALTLVALATGLSTLGAYQLFPYLPGPSFDSWLILRNMLVALVITAVVLRYFYLQSELRQLDRSVLQARLDVLQARIRPHFLFNTLNSIASLIETRPEVAEGAVEDLADLFRASLREDSAAVTVADEVQLCERYLQIESLRLGDRLQVRWQLDEGAMAQRMPSLVLQPLVENAVYHGISRIPEGGCIDIRIASDGKQVVIEVCNPVAPGPAKGGMNIGLENTRLRLQALYGEAAGLKLSGGAEAFCVRLHYPCERRSAGTAAKEAAA